MIRSILSFLHLVCVLTVMSLTTPSRADTDSPQCERNPLSVRYSIERILPPKGKVIIRAIKGGNERITGIGGCIGPGETLILPDDVALVDVFDGSNVLQCSRGNCRLEAKDSFGEAVAGALRFIARTYAALSRPPTQDLPKVPAIRGEEEAVEANVLRPVVALSVPVAQKISLATENLVVGWRDGKGPVWECRATRISSMRRSAGSTALGTVTSDSDQWCVLKLVGIDAGDTIELELSDGSGSTVVWKITVVSSSDVPLPPWAETGPVLQGPPDETAWALWLLQSKPEWRLYVLAELYRLQQHQWLAGHVLRRILSESELAR